jgi:hypothetical protein
MAAPPVESGVPAGTSSEGKRKLNSSSGNRSQLAGRSVNGPREAPLAEQRTQRSFRR